MLLSEIAADIGAALPEIDTEIVSVEYDSRKVRPGSLFCCLPGVITDGHRFAKQAAENGAAALLVEHRVDVDLPQLLVPDGRTGMALASACFYGHPEREMTLLAVTGTNGKTSTTYMVRRAAMEAGHTVGLIGTIQNLIGDTPIHTAFTTPESRDLFALFRQMADAGVDTVIMEVSSQALAQKRTAGVPFTAGVFTNLTQDHLDYHKTFEAYRDAKKLMFRQCALAIVNRDDPEGAFMASGLACPVQTFSLEKGADFWAEKPDVEPGGVSFTMHTPAGDMALSMHISGLFTVYNAMGAAALCLAAGIPLPCVEKGLNELDVVNGRLERVPSDKPFAVYVDYAHTPDALVNVLKTAREFTKHRLICLFGCGGDRDHGKRPLMGEAAGQYSDFVIVTTDNPRTEDPMTIIRAAEEGVVKTGTPYTVIEDRRTAIGAAIRMGEPGDVIILAGKGHENYQEINHVRRHFDDKEIAAEFLAEGK